MRSRHKLKTKYLLFCKVYKPMVTKLGRMMTYDDGNSPIMSDDFLIT